MIKLGQNRVSTTVYKRCKLNYLTKTIIILVQVIVQVNQSKRASSLTLKKHSQVMIIIVVIKRSYLYLPGRGGGKRWKSQNVNFKVTKLKLIYHYPYKQVLFVLVYKFYKIYIMSTSATNMSFTESLQLVSFLLN